MLCYLIPCLTNIFDLLFLCMVLFVLLTLIGLIKIANKKKCRRSKLTECKLNILPSKTLEWREGEVSNDISRVVGSHTVYYSAHLFAKLVCWHRISDLIVKKNQYFNEHYLTFLKLMKDWRILILNSPLTHQFLPFNCSKTRWHSASFEDA